MSKRLAVVLIEKFADWEHGFLTAAVQDFFCGTTHFYTPGGADVTSEGGMRPRPDSKLEGLGLDDFDGLAVIGSSVWGTDKAPNLDALLRAAVRAGRPMGFICKGTMAAAQAGLFDERPHTSNSLDTLKAAPAYHGAAQYQDVPHAVRDGNLVRASGTAPRSFAFEMASLMFPEKGEELGWMKMELTAEKFG